MRILIVTMTYLIVSWWLFTMRPREDLVVGGGSFFVHHENSHGNYAISHGLMVNQKTLPPPPPPTTRWSRGLMVKVFLLTNQLCLRSSSVSSRLHMGWEKDTYGQEQYQMVKIYTHHLHKTMIIILVTRPYLMVSWSTKISPQSKEISTTHKAV